MQLHELYVNDKITDEGIKHMQLQTLDASHNKKITDEGIKHMQLHKVYISDSKNITKDGTKHIKNCVLNECY